MIHRNDLSALATGFMAMFAGIGIARFAYTPMIPLLVQQGWFDAAQAVYLGAANLLGYLLGALSAHRLSERFAPRRVLAAAFLAIVVGFVACAQPSGFAWFFLWRFLAGVAGAVLMVVGPSLAIAATPAERRPLVGAFVFSGIGFGVLLAALLLPAMIRLGLGWTWFALGGLSLAAWLLCDIGAARLARANPAGPRRAAAARPALAAACVLVLLAYALDAVGFVPHTVFWVDYLARERGLGSDAAAAQWALFGLGAILGPILAGFVVRRSGWHAGLASAFLVKGAAVGLPLLTLGALSNSLSSLAVGALTPGLVALVSGRLAELVGPVEHKRVWGYATAVFALTQAAAGYSLSALYDVLGTYYPLFAVGSLALGGGFVVVLLSGRAGVPAALVRDAR